MGSIKDIVLGYLASGQMPVGGHSGDPLGFVSHVIAPSGSKTFFLVRSVSIHSL